MWLDAVLIDEPAQHLGRAVGAVAGEPGRIEVETVHRPLDHALGRGHLDLADGGDRLDVHDDAMVEVDEVVGGIGEERLPAMGAHPARRRIGGRDELRRHLGRVAECRVIQHGQILVDRAARHLRRQALGAFDALLAAGIGLDQADVDGKAVAVDETLFETAAQHRLEHMP